MDGAVPRVGGRPQLVALAEDIGHGVGAALDVAAVEERAAIVADLLHPVQDQVGLPVEGEGQRACQSAEEAFQTKNKLTQRNPSALRRPELRAKCNSDLQVLPLNVVRPRNLVGQDLHHDKYNFYCLCWFAV